jgi:hypothetical protein
MHEIPDRDLVLSLTPEKANALADRFERVSDKIGRKKKKPRYDSVLTVKTYDVPEVQAQLEKVLDKMTKRWQLDEIVQYTGKPSEIFYLVRLRKSVPRDDFMTAIHQGADGMIDDANLETGAPIEERDAVKS